MQVLGDHAARVLVNLASSVAVLTENRMRRAELEAALEAVRESERVRDVAESIARVGSWRFDLATQRARWSPEMYRLFDLPDDHDDVVSLLFETRIHPDDRAEAEIHRLNAELEDRVASRTARLEAANRELETFACSVSHDLRAPLRAIDGFSQMVVEDAGDRLAEDDLQHLMRVRRAAQRMASMIDNLLALSRASRTELNRESVDVGAVALSIVEELRVEQPKREVSIVVASDLWAAADATLVRLILANLLGSAWKFTSKRESAHIEVGVFTLSEQSAAR